MKWHELTDEDRALVLRYLEVSADSRASLYKGLTAAIEVLRNAPEPASIENGRLSPDDSQNTIAVISAGR